MCGICGIYGVVDKPIDKMLKVLEHRGKDGQNTYVDDYVGLGHTRLAIIDLSNAGIQPMSNEDKTVWLIINGEIYNYKELRLLLLKRGHQFKSNSDSEVVIHAYEQWGKEFLNRLRGMYALAIYDVRNKELILARDPIGKKPLYFCMERDRLVFASEIKAILEIVKSEINYSVITDILIYQYSLGRDTLFKNIRKIRAGEMLVVNPQNVAFSLYWKIKELIGDEPDDSYVGRLKLLLNDSVKLRLQSDVPVGTFLSGGLDSSTITALYRKYSNNTIHTFTATFDTFSEAEYAQCVSSSLGVEYHEVPINPKMIANDIYKIAWHYDEPLGDAAIINNYYLAKEASKYVKVVLAGEGGDELFGGYPWYKFVRYMKYIDKIPFGWRLFGQLFIGKCNPMFIWEKYRRMLLFLLQEDTRLLMLYPETSASVNNIEWLMGDLEYYALPFVNYEVKDVYNKMLAMDCMNLLPEKFLMKADKATMSSTIEERLPLLDKEIIQFSFTLPIHLKQDKYILREAAKDLLPYEIVHRDKVGFGTPIINWLNSPDLSELLYDRLSSGVLLRQICKGKSLDKLIKYCNDGKLKESNIMALSVGGLIWNLFVLQIWHDVYFGGHN